jgi:hypothetical protein
MVTVDPLELEAAQNQDAAMQSVHPVESAEISLARKPP